MIIAIDFDGTICDHAFPGIGAEKKDAIKTIKYLQECGHTLILWTCRTNHHLAAALDWLKERGVTFDHVNESAPTEYLQELGDTRKVYYDVLIDDKCFMGFGECFEWVHVRWFFEQNELKNKENMK